jgi:hypothetical protein
VLFVIAGKIPLTTMLLLATFVLTAGQFLSSVVGRQSKCPKTGQKIERNVGIRMGVRTSSVEKAAYKVAICPVCNEGELHVAWEPGLFRTDELGFIHLPVSMDKFHETFVATRCPVCEEILRIRLGYISIEHRGGDGAIDIYHNWELKEGAE